MWFSPEGEEAGVCIHQLMLWHFGLLRAWAKEVFGQGKPKAAGLGVANYRILHKGTLRAQQHGRTHPFMVSGMGKFSQ